MFLSCETSFKLFMTESKKLCIMFQVELITDTEFLLPHIFTASSIYHFQIINYFLILGSVDGVQKTIEFQSLINAADQFSFSQQIFYTEFQFIICLTQCLTLVEVKVPVGDKAWQYLQPDQRKTHLQKDPIVVIDNCRKYLSVLHGFIKMVSGPRQVIVVCDTWPPCHDCLDQCQIPGISPCPHHHKHLQGHPWHH